MDRKTKAKVDVLLLGHSYKRAMSDTFFFAFSVRDFWLFVEHFLALHSAVEVNRNTRAAGSLTKYSASDGA